MRFFARKLLDWYAHSGRSHFPWQHNRTPYRVWVAEVMLQQTQTETVVPYFERFTREFPNLASLAQAETDAVLALWSGLGYYARARNLHRTARICIDEYGGDLPTDAATLNNLPGIGRSTANAIIAQAWNQRAPILDGNVKRVLARLHAVEGWPGKSAVMKCLWELAELETPAQDAASYTQAIMDLGATVCTPRNPACSHCPVRATCAAFATDRQAELPHTRPRRKVPERTRYWLLAGAVDRFLLQQRPPSGIWGGLLALPEFESRQQLATWAGVSESALADPIAEIRHTFSHFKLIAPVYRIDALPSFIMDSGWRWVQRKELPELGLPSPVRSFLETQ